MAKKHEVNEAAGVTPEIAAELDRAMEEMANDNDFDESASPSFVAAELGTSSHARKRSSGATTSHKIALHDTPYVQLKNAHPYLESDDIEALLEMCYGKSVLEASAENFGSFDREIFEEIMALDQLQVEALLEDDEDEADEEDA